MKRFVPAAILLATSAAAFEPPPVARVPAAAARVHVGFLVAAVSDSALGELGLEGTGVEGLALPADHESLFKLSFRLLSLEERKLARVLGTPALLAESGSSAHHEGDGLRPTVIDVRASERSGTTMLDVAITGGELAKRTTLRGSGGVGTWALLGDARKAGETVVVIVTSQADEPPAPPPSAE